MSTFANISPLGNPAAPQNSGEGRNHPADTAGVAGVFADLVAQALSTRTPVPNENPFAGPGEAELNGKGQAQSPDDPAKIANHHSGKIRLQVVSSQEIAGNSILALVTARNPERQVDAVQSNGGTAEKSIGKSGESGKGEKNSPPQAGQPGPEIQINQIIAAAIPLANLISIPPSKLQLNSVSVSLRPPATDEGPPVPVAAAQSKKNSTTVPNRSTLALPLKDIVADGEPSAAGASSPAISQGAGTLAKSEEHADSFETSVDLLEAKSALNSAGHQSINQIAAGPRAAESPSDSNGISIAKQDISVKQVEKTNNIAGQTEKVLPGNTSVAIQAGTRLPVSFHPDQITPLLPAGSTVPEDSSAASTLAVQSVPVVSSPNTPVVERMQEMVTLNAVRLNDSGNNSMQVVIKPDSGTQLSLELRQHGGEVEVQAVLQQGDFHHLNQQWPDLQHRLGQRGIQLAPLAANATGSQAGAEGSFQRRQQPTAEAVDEIHFAAASAAQIVPAIAQAPVTEPARTRHGWETWA